MDRHCRNAAAVARTLDDHPAVETVYYPGLASHPGHDVAAEQMDGFGGMVALELTGGVEAATAFVAALETVTVAESLGGVESLVEVPAAMTHQDLSRRNSTRRASTRGSSAPASAPSARRTCWRISAAGWTRWHRWPTPPPRRSRTCPRSRRRSSASPRRTRPATDAREFVARGTPAIVWGPGSLDQAHTVDEWIDLGEATRCLAVAKAEIRETLAGGI
jgi:hypothetical protein